MAYGSCVALNARTKILVERKHFRSVSEIPEMMEALRTQ